MPDTVFTVFGAVFNFMVKKRHSRLIRGIRVKAIIFVCVIPLVTTVIGISLGYILGNDLIYNIIASENVAKIDLVSRHISMIIDNEIHEIETHINSVLIRDAIIEANQKYNSMKKEDIEYSLKGLDQKWLSSNNMSFLEKYLDNDVSYNLRDLLSGYKNIEEIFITDRYGGLVAASSKTSDFYQADEGWWQKAFFYGKGRVYVSGLTLDMSSMILGLTIAIPIRDKYNSLIGVCKAVVDINKFFKHLELFGVIGKEHIMITDQSGRLIFHPGYKALTVDIFEEEDYKRFISNKKGWGILSKTYIHNNEQFLAFSAINHPILLENKVYWHVFLAKNKKDVFSPAKGLVPLLGTITNILLIVLIVLGFLLGKGLVKPIEKLDKAIKNVSNGNLECNIDVKTGDEIEDLANSFKLMVSQLEKRELELEEEKLYKEQIINSMSDSLIVVNSDATIRDVNKATSNLLGYNKEELIGHPMSKIFSIEELTQKGIEIERFIEEGKDYNTRLMYKSKSKKDIPVDFSISVMRKNYHRIDMRDDLGPAKDIDGIVCVARRVKT